MNNKKCINKTIELVKTMAKYADFGPSGFWVEDHEGCGNPDIFPEFKEGLKTGDYIRKEHYICPWNKAVLYGDKHGNIHTGCYHSCAILDAKYLSGSLLKEVLLRFNERLSAGKYDDLEHIEPLLNQQEIAYIENQKEIEKNKKEKQYQQECELRIKKANKLISKFNNNEEIKELLKHYYGEDTLVDTHEFGLLDFSRSHLTEVVSKMNLIYDDFLEAQFNSKNNQRSWFKRCYYNFPSRFKGKIERITKDRICFEKIFVEGMYSDGIKFFKGKEDHVWMENKGFEKCEVGDCFSFYAEVYPYLKTSNGKKLDFSLRNPDSIKRINDYNLPTDDELIRQGIDQIVCETCFLSDHYDFINCLRDSKEIRRIKRQMFETLKNK